MTIGAKIKVTGTSGSATAALNRTRAAAGGLDTGLGKLAGTALAAGAGVLGFGAATEAARRLVQLAQQAVSKYAESNTEVAERLAGTSSALDDLQAAIGATIIGGDNLEQMTGGLNIAVGGLTEIIEDNEEAFQALAVGGFRVVVNGALLVGRGMIRAVAVGMTFKEAVLSWADAMIVAGSSAAALSLELSEGVNTALADFVENAEGSIAGAHPFSQILGGLSDRFGGLDRMTQGASDALRANAAAISENAELMRGVAAEAIEAQRDRTGELTASLTDLLDVEGDLVELGLAFNKAMDDGSAAAASFREEIDELTRAMAEANSHKPEEKEAAADAARLARLNALKVANELAWSKEAEGLAYIAEKREADLAHSKDLAIEEIEMRLHLDAIKADAHAADEARRAAEMAGTMAAVDGSLAGFGRLAAGNDKLTKALNIAAGARLAGQAVFQLNTGIGYALSGAYAQGVALIAQSAISFAEAAKMGFGGGGKKGGASRQSVTTVNQTNVFAGNVDSGSAPGFIEQLQAASRAGALEGAR